MAESRLSSRALVQLLGEWRGSTSAYLGLADAIRVLCLDRRIAPGTALPAERDLAAKLDLSRTTVAAAYRSLRESGHVASLRGSGSVIRALGSVAAAPAPGGAETIDLHQASPAAWPGLEDLFLEATAQLPRLLREPGYDMVGAPTLRAAIADRYTAQGLPTHPDQIVVTPGAQSAISLLVGVITRRGERAAIETPTYPHAADVLRRAGTLPVTIPVDPAQGWDLERAEHVLRRAAPSLAYLMPDFQNPTGASMTPATRVALLEAARDSGVTLIADETTAELAIDRPGPFVPFGVGADASTLRQLVTIGSLGKSVWGGLRIGWIRADEDLVSRIVAARPTHDLGTPAFEQVVAELALARMPEILAQRSTLLRAGRDALLGALTRRLPAWTVTPPRGGVAMWVGLGAPVSSPLALAARERGLVLSSGPRFGVDGGHERHLRLPFTAASAVLEDAVDLLADAWHDVAQRGYARRDPLLAVV